MDFDLSGKCVYVAGHTGLVGAALCARLGSEGCDVLVPFDFGAGALYGLPQVLTQHLAANAATDIVT